MAKAQQTPVADADDTAFDDEFDADPNTSFDDEDEDDLGQPKDGVDSADEDDDADVEMRIEDVLKKPVGQIFSAIALQGVSSHAKKRPVSALDDAWLRTTHTRIKGLMTANPDAPEGDRWDRDLQLLESESDVRKLDLDAEPKPPKATKTVTAPAGTIAIVALATAAISPDPAQARDEGADDELASSIASVGVLQPIRVYEDVVHPGFYIIEDGERRYRGTVKAGIKTIPAVVVPAPESVGDKLLIQVASNDGKRLKPMEEARAFKRIMADKGWTAQQLADALGKKKSTVGDRLAIVDVPKVFAEYFEQGVLSAAAAPMLRMLNELPDRALARVTKSIVDEYDWEDAVAESLRDKKPIPLTVSGTWGRSVETFVANAMREELRPIGEGDAKLGVEYKGKVVKVGKTEYALDVAAYDAAVKKAQANPVATKAKAEAKAKLPPSEVKRRAEERNRQKKAAAARAKEKAARDEREQLHGARVAAVFAKMPDSIDGKLALLLIRIAVDGVTALYSFDDAAADLLGIPSSVKKFTGYNGTSRRVLAWAEKLDTKGRIRLLLRLSVYSDSPPHKDIDWLSQAADILNVDLKKVKATEFPGSDKAAAESKALKKGATKKARR